jgi:serine/threonine protein kinase
MSPEMVDLDGMFFLFFVCFHYIIFISGSGKESDIWSLGILLFVLVEKKYPYSSVYREMNEFHRKREIIKEIKNGVLKSGKVLITTFVYVFFFFVYLYRFR